MKKNKLKNISVKILMTQFFLLLVFFSCNLNNNMIENTLKSSFWGIDTIYYRNQGNYYNMFNFMSGNMLFFEKGKIIIPGILPSKENAFNWSKKGKWALIKSEGDVPYYILIDSQNEIFNGHHKIWFYKDEKNKLLKMVLFSDKLYMVASKSLLNYDQNIRKINELVKITEKQE